MLGASAFVPSARPSRARAAAGVQSAGEQAVDDLVHPAAQSQHPAHYSADAHYEVQQGLPDIMHLHHAWARPVKGH